MEKRMAKASINRTAANRTAANRTASSRKTKKTNVKKTAQKNKALDQIPKHLKRYLVKQEYSRYSPEDHAVWRFIMRELTYFLYKHAHPSYKMGLKKTGVTLDKIPSITHIDRCLKKLGWRAGGVSGFIPPAAFLELQAHSILPIATEMRRVDHLDYTPAPDIVHEAAGHAPLLANKKYSQYLKRYAEVASKAIITKKDMDQYAAIRDLSDLKEHPNATDAEIKEANERFLKASEALRDPTEAVMLARMGWWTTEYGLMGELHDPKIIGAGLMSSVGESRHCLSSSVRKIPFSIDCVNYSYDITDPQPQLFVARDFDDLEQGLEALASKMAFRRGGVFGLKRMKEAETVNTIELCSGLQISGTLASYKESETTESKAGPQSKSPIYVQLKGPTQLSFNGKELKGQGVKYHKEGYGTAVGMVEGFPSCLSEMSDAELKAHGVEKKKPLKLQYKSGVVVEGVLQKTLRQKALGKKSTAKATAKSKLLLMTFKNCTVSYKGETLFRPEWGPFDLGLGCEVVSVFGGAADRQRYGATDDFVNKKLPPKKYTPQEKFLHKIYDKINKGYAGKKYSDTQLMEMIEGCRKEHPKAWLARFDLLNLSRKNRWQNKDGFKSHYESLKNEILSIAQEYPSLEPYVKNSLNLIEGRK